MTSSRLPQVALLWSQFAAYHVDRCEAVAARLAGRAEVIAVEVATTSTTYAWAPSGEVAGARKVTLFPGESRESIAPLRLLYRQFRLLRRCRMVFLGVGYNEVDIILLSWLLRLCGVYVVTFSESKFDDLPRRAGFELGKALALLPYRAAVVGARRHMDYFRFLGFHRRAVLPGYDSVRLARVLAQGGGVPAPAGTPHGQRHFIFIGRFVEKKNLGDLIEGYAAYCAAAGSAAHRLVLVGAGPQEPAIRARIAALCITDKVDMPGFLGPEGVSRLLADALALALVSSVEQWGLVVNEALAFHLPVIVSGAVGARDALVQNLVNGYVIDNGSATGIAQAMTALADEANWRRLVTGSRDLAWLGDTERLADAVELLFDPGANAAAIRIARFKAAIGWDDDRYAPGWSRRQK
ncbi:MAG: glycosyltransferase [Pseudomonadota bacterium]|nr:glycosyltransferase [Pseudomonadota bacterium]